MILCRNGPSERTAFGLAAPLNDGFALHVDRLRDGWIRIAVVPSSGLAVDRTWLVTPDEDVAWEGRDRLTTEGFRAGDIHHGAHGFADDRLRVRLSADGGPLALNVEQRVGDGWVAALVDRPDHAWRWSQQRSATTHYSLLPDEPRHWGLGDAAGSLDRTGRRIRCLQSDALGYDAERSDPLYKHAPFVACGDGETAFGLLYDTMSECVFDLGAEHSNYFRRYRHVEAQERGMVVHLFAGPGLREVVDRLYAATGRRAFPPRWSLGFAFTSMHHADAPNAQDVIEGFAREARVRELPISAIHFGSGYTANANGLRCVFNWNEDRFPDRKIMFARLKSLGFRTVANVKPVLLTEHFAFERANNGGWFVRRADGSPAIERFWGGQGASLDFSNAEAVAWWRAGIREQVLEQGFDAVWNDNNEAELWDEDARVAGCGVPLQGTMARPLQALLMTRASTEATLAHRPDDRPHAISRAGPIGIARYGETWSGDNRTSWHTLRWNLRQGLSMSLSGMPLVGHDIGGFVGAPPGPELLVRWFQMMALHPRCLMNSWKADHGDVPNLPWMHESVFEHVRAALRLRYAFLPTLYSLVWHGGPVIVPPFLHYPHTPEGDTFMLGPDILVAPVVEENVREIRVDLPEGEEWLEMDGTVHDGGISATIAAPLERLPILVRAGGVVAFATDWEAHSPHDATAIELRGFAGRNAGASEGSFLLDDGLSHDPSEDEVLRWRFERVRGGGKLTFAGRPSLPVTTRIVGAP